MPMTRLGDADIYYEDCGGGKTEPIGPLRHRRRSGFFCARRRDKAGEIARVPR
jgi:hypothetical protein